MSERIGMKPRHEALTGLALRRGITADRWLTFVVAMAIGSFVSAAEDNRVHYGLGQTPSDELVSSWDIAIGPDGAELPAGSGTVAAGEQLYAKHCAMCHGASGIEGPDPVLVGGHGTLASDNPIFTVGNYWAYATTLYDYIYRAMPFIAPGSLEPNEVYALCAFLLNANGIIAENAVMDRVSLPAVRMPNRDAFFPDPRPDVGPR